MVFTDLHCHVQWLKALPHGQECCDQEVRFAGQVLRFAELRGDAVLRHARQFVAGWLVSKIFMHNLRPSEERLRGRQSKALKRVLKRESLESFTVFESLRD